MSASIVEDIALVILINILCVAAVFSGQPGTHDATWLEKFSRRGPCVSTACPTMGGAPATGIW